MILTSALGRTLVIAAAVFLIDRASKIFVVERLGLAALGRIEVADPWLNLTMAWNEGVNFGLLDLGADGRWWLIGLALAIVAALLWWVRRRPGWAPAVGAGAVAGGALGNVWDRVQWGAVADFLNVSCCGLRNPFAFNVADAAIFTGVLVLILFGGEAPRQGQGARGRGRDARRRLR